MGSMGISRVTLYGKALVIRGILRRGAALAIYVLQNVNTLYADGSTSEGIRAGLTGSRI